MKLTLIKQTDIDGKIWYIVRQDNFAGKLFQDEKTAREYYDNVKNNSVKEEILSETIL